MRSIAGAAGVSQKTVEAVFRTKAAVLRASVQYAIRGDVDPLPMPQRAAVARMEQSHERSRDAPPARRSFAHG